MTAPFALPDVADLYAGLGDIDPYATNVPCRQVPQFNRLVALESSGQVMFGLTHWVDFEPDVFLADEASPTASLMGQSFQAAVPIIKIQLTDVLLVLAVLFVEDRFTGTDNEYIRAHCQRLQRFT